ncbi:hypothetical protein SMUGS5_08520 [Streptococcus mutans GS-5]|nr:hypothetical protein SMUGS5_08520 [Streptococcus mutans GS-5]
MSWSQLNQKCGVSLSNLKYMVKLMDPYDLERVRKGNNIYLSPELKQEMIDTLLKVQLIKVNSNQWILQEDYFTLIIIFNNYSYSALYCLKVKTV